MDIPGQYVEILKGGLHLLCSWRGRCVWREMGAGEIMSNDLEKPQIVYSFF